MKTAGLDLGAEGALVVRMCDGTFNFVTFPKLNNKFYEYGCFSCIKDFLNEHEVNMVYCEDLASIFGASAKANMQFGKTIGIQMAAVWAAGADIQEIHSKTWQKHMIENEDIVMELDKKTGKMKNSTKKTALNAASRLFEGVSFRATKRSTTPHDGIVDALLIDLAGNKIYNTKP